MEKTERKDRKLVFANGRDSWAPASAAAAEALCECSFDTAMIGYQEILSDPASAGEALVMTYPVIGSYGMADEDYESRLCPVGCLIVRQYNDRPSNFRYTKTLAEVMLENDIPGIQGVDTRAITRMLRDEGSMKVLLTHAATPLDKAMEQLKNMEAGPRPGGESQRQEDPALQPHAQLPRQCGGRGLRHPPEQHPLPDGPGLQCDHRAL